MLKRLLFSLLLCALGGSLPADAQHLGILLGEGRHDTEYDVALRSLPWTVSRYACSKEGMQELSQSLDRIDLLVTVPLFNWQSKEQKILQPGDTDAAALVRWLEKGGGLVVPDGCYDQVLDWLQTLSPAFGGVVKGRCNSSPWQVKGYVTNPEPVHPLRAFPNPITEGNSWGHFEEPAAGSAWKVIARCSEGKPVGLLQTVGKGFVYLTTLRQPVAAPLENCMAYTMLRKAGVDVASSDMKPLRPGRNALSMQLATDAPEGTGLTLTLKDETGRQTRFSAPFSGRSCTLPFSYDVRGVVEQTLTLDLPAAPRTLFTRKVTLPEVLELSPNAYRGLLSTRRREKEVDFLVQFAPGERDLTAATLTLSAYSASSNCVHREERTLPADEVPARLWVPVALPQELAPGAYELRAELTKGELTFRDETAFEILAPRQAQSIIDEDGTFLVNGMPYFPLGIYHTSMEFEKLADIGFNACQLWIWETGNDYGNAQHLARASGLGIRALLESNLGAQPWMVDKLQDNPGLLMWYVKDEPNESHILDLEKLNGTWHKLDKQHPTYICSCRPDLFAMHANYCDVLGFNPGYQGGYEIVTKTIEWIKRAQAATEGRKCLVLVPGALSHDNVEMAPALAYAAITHDIRGFIWYCWEQVGGGPVGIGLNKDPKGQALIKELLAEIRTLTPGLTSPGRRTFEEGALCGIVCPNQEEKKRLVVLFNSADEKLDVDVTIPELANQPACYDALTGKPLSCVSSEGRVTAQLAPLSRLTISW